ncbi:Sorbitol dehydrogenase [Hibiscus syriacus]|uniref:Sorbitol dehydrogenase n=1 Tax=Hibiscus syriacus TaxID=106335 RepID=A0A6A2XPQ9_HIBSY|nr:Sorbitol dehydrogenase [Hibiscus syriacus]
MGRGESHEINMAAWLVGINTLKIQPFKLPTLGPRDVKVRMQTVGICGSDVHFLKTLRLADYIVKEPMVIGHECAGIIEEVGSEVKNLVPGDRVALETGISCWRCNPCKEVVHPADLCFKLPDNLSLEEGAMCEPLSVAVHACRRADISPEINVFIMGEGPIGPEIIFRYKNTRPLGIELLRSGKINVKLFSRRG